MTQTVFPTYYCAESFIDVVLPTDEIIMDPSDTYFIIGRPGVDGIEFRIKKDQTESAVYAFYPIEGEHIKIAESVEDLIHQWKTGTILL